MNISSTIIDDLDKTRANWSAISDNVMGGISEVNFYEMDDGTDKFYRLEGSVSTKNNGGFIQSVIRFPINAQDFQGIRFKIRVCKNISNHIDSK